MVGHLRAAAFARGRGSAPPGTVRGESVKEKEKVLPKWTTMFPSCATTILKVKS